MAAKLTVIIPCKNERRNIRPCIESVRSIADELVIADSGSTDGTLDIAREASAGLAAVARETGVPVGFGVLTVEDEAQAVARSRKGPGNKGAEAARAALAMVHVVRALQVPRG